MSYYLEYGNKKAKCIELKINPKVPFPKIVQSITRIGIAGCSKAELIHYAVLELVSNSVRSHLEKNVQENIHVILSIQEEKLTVNVEDRGGGFNPAVLPYDITFDPDSIDVNSETFQKYREHHNYSRFGMGLLSAKRTFPELKIQFVTQKGVVTSWSEAVIGTYISGELYLK
ncbi:MAG TPA: ATP-binding protein [Spirochaetia bacterium]|nr:ATP-binding protein [Spirochaetales bacterium]HRS66073.1 ATP-binding protein [Spirochaetia bacterium]HOT58252.1 ATP-binding protein [Spirochaetales bacterium]HPD81251.1 ATP-binding protein [Spirochaetales bacterium]HQK34798.1 ATP-binding protein [Spirochaetales bacterium]